METTNITTESILKIKEDKNIQIPLEQKNQSIKDLFGKLKDWNINTQEFKDKTRNE
tara:strand:- start:1112 stop:1279 length:168 start_codon:yes stop_codon:yes gene_type:complete